jgi:hypothetical protein
MNTGGKMKSKTKTREQVIRELNALVSPMATKSPSNRSASKKKV